jgi:hypothetical protein
LSREIKGWKKIKVPSNERGPVHVESEHTAVPLTAKIRLDIIGVTKNPD